MSQPVIGHNAVVV